MQEAIAKFRQGKHRGMQEHHQRMLTDNLQHFSLLSPSREDPVDKSMNEKEKVVQLDLSINHSTSTQSFPREATLFQDRNSEFGSSCMMID